MTFFSLSLCKELQAAGCASQSQNKWLDLGYDTKVRCDLCSDGFGSYKIIAPAFTLLDFIAPTIQARGNARIWFGERIEDADREYGETAWNYHRRQMVELSPSADVEEYFRKHRRAE